MTITNRIIELATRRRTRKDWVVLGIVTIGLTVEMLDAGVGLREIAAHQHFAADSIIDVADVAVGVVAAWLIRLA